MKRRGLVLVALVTLLPGAALARGAARVEPVRPGSLAVGPHGVLYVADAARNEILARLPDGSFRVVAAGLRAPAGMAVARDGTLYVADAGHDRVLAIAPSGAARTIARLLSPAAVALRRGSVYVAAPGANEIVRVAKNGRLVRVAGTGNVGPAGVHGIGRPAIEASADGPNGLAFDRAGDLFVAGSNTKTLLMVARDGTMRLPDGPDGFYPRGNGGLVSTADGRVLGMNGQRIVRIAPRGVRTVVDFRNRLDGFQPNGIAVAPGGAIYTDTYVGNGFATASALVEVSPAGRVRVLWRG
jgi:DNA-binding beta-propeller fold protein YncE